MIEYKVDWPVQLRIANYNCCAVLECIFRPIEILWNITGKQELVTLLSLEVINGGKCIMSMNTIKAQVFWKRYSFVLSNFSLTRETETKKENNVAKIQFLIW